MTEKTTDFAKILSKSIVEGLIDKKGKEITRISLKNVPGAVTDYFVLCTGTSNKHVQALCDSVQKIVKEQEAEKPISVEGFKSGEWILMDYVNVMVHIFLKEKREFYDIESLWADGAFEKLEAVEN